jgi:hypothetical protein
MPRTKGEIQVKTLARFSLIPIVDMVKVEAKLKGRSRFAPGFGALAAEIPTWP